MILQEKIKIKTSKKNDKWLKEKGYNFIVGDVIEINTNDINHGSHIEIDVCCDICNSEKKLSFQKYIKNINNGGFYACSSKCAQKRLKIHQKKNSAQNIICKQMNIRKDTKTLV